MQLLLTTIQVAGNYTTKGLIEAGKHVDSTLSAFVEVKVFFSDVVRPRSGNTVANSSGELTVEFIERTPKEKSLGDFASLIQRGKPFD